MALLDYSNYKTGQQEIFDIVQTCLVKAGLPVDGDSFRRGSSGIKMNYVTNGNDTFLTILKYLLNRLYYFGDRDQSFKFLLWNYMKNMYQLVDIAKSAAYAGAIDDMDRIVLSLFNSAGESGNSPDQQQLGTITKFPADRAARGFFKIDAEEYDYATNSFSTETTDSQTLINYFNQRIDS